MEKISVILPCLNEEANLKAVIEEIRSNKDFDIEIVVIDNGSIDNSADIAKKMGCSVFKEDKKGYGNALRLGNKVCKNEYVIMADCDSTYELSNLKKFIDALRDNDLVVGNRFKGGVDRREMNMVHFIGNKFLSGIAKILYKTPVSDFHCGLRAFKKSKINELDFKTGGMEYATEMIILASKNNFKMIEVPTILRKAKHERVNHLRPIRDGLRHLKIIIKYKFCK